MTKETVAAASCVKVYISSLTWWMRGSTNNLESWKCSSRHRQEGKRSFSLHFGLTLLYINFSSSPLHLRVRFHFCLRVCQVEGWLAGWWSEIQQLWVEMGSYCADIWCLTVQDFLFFIFLPGETEKKKTRRDQAPRPTHKQYKQRLGGWVRGAEEAGKCCICFLIDAMHSAWGL